MIKCQGGNLVVKCIFDCLNVQLCKNFTQKTSHTAEISTNVVGEGATFYVHPVYRR